MFNTAVRTFVFSILVTLISVIFSILMARILGPESRGVLGGIITASTLFAALGQLGVGHSYVYFRRKYHSRDGLKFILFTNLITVILLHKKTLRYLSCKKIQYVSFFFLFSFFLFVFLFSV